MAEEEGEEVEPPKNGKFIFPGPKGDGLDVYDGDWAEGLPPPCAICWPYDGCCAPG